MDWVHAHLLVNHFPVILAVVASGAALVAVFTRRDGAWLFAAVSGLLAGVTSPAAYISGDEAHHTVEKFWYASHDAIEAHEEAALWAMIALLVAAVLAAWALWKRSGRARGAFAVAIWFATLVTAVTALRGGDIVHESEKLRSSAPPTESGQRPPPGLNAGAAGAP